MCISNSDMLSNQKSGSTLKFFKSIGILIEIVLITSWDAFKLKVFLPFSQVELVSQNLRELYKIQRK
jgi:hypothetical protein